MGRLTLALMSFGQAQHRSLELGQQVFALQHSIQDVVRAPVEIATVDGRAVGVAPLPGDEPQVLMPTQRDGYGGNLLSLGSIGTP